MSDHNTANKPVKLLIAGFFLLLANSSYLFGYAEPMLFYFGNIVLHLLLGIALTIGFGVYAAKRLKRMSRVMLVTSALLGLGAAFGFLLMYTGTTRPYRWALYTHIALTAAGSALMLIMIFRASRGYIEARQRRVGYVFVLSLVFIFPVATNDYGIGLLLQGDIKGVEAAFLRVTEMDPDYADGWVNVARAKIQEGNMQAAEQVLRKALEIDANLAKTHFFLAMAIKPSGRYDEALEHLRFAASLYPRDRVVLNQMGRVLFLNR